MKIKQYLFQMLNELSLEIQNVLINYLLSSSRHHFTNEITWDMNVNREKRRISDQALEVCYL